MAEPLNIYRASNFQERLLGLLARPRLSARQGLWLDPCWAVHTFGLGYDIDVVFLDAGLNILKVESSLKPGRVAFCRRASSTVELLGGYCRLDPHYANTIRRALVELA